MTESEQTIVDVNPETGSYDLAKIPTGGDRDTGVAGARRIIAPPRRLGIFSESAR